MDDVTGLPLDKAMAIIARRTEMEYFKKMQVYAKVIKQPWMKPITTRWLDVNKGDCENPSTGHDWQGERSSVTNAMI